VANQQCFYPIISFDDIVSIVCIHRSKVLHYMIIMNSVAFSTSDVIIHLTSEVDILE
jgi:hypothetical protein